MRREKQRRFRLGEIIRKRNDGLSRDAGNAGEASPPSGPDTKRVLPPSHPRTFPDTPARDLPGQPVFDRQETTGMPSSEASEQPTQFVPSHRHVPTEPAVPAGAHSRSDTGTSQTQQLFRAEAGQDEEEHFDLFRYLAVVMRRKGLIIVVTLVACIYGLLSFLRSPKYYTAKARLLFRPGGTSIIDENPSWIRRLDRDRDLNTHLELLRSTVVLELVAGNFRDINNAGSMQAHLRVTQGEVEGRENDIIELSYKHRNAATARDALNDVCKGYIDYRRDVNAQEDTRLIVKLNAQIEKVQRALTGKEDALREFKEEHRLVQLSRDANLVMTKLADMELAYQQTQIQLLETKERLTTLKSQISQQEVNVVQSMTYENPIQSRLADLELELNTLSAEYSPDHFKVRTIASQIEKLKQALQNEVTNEAVKHTLVKNPIRESLLQTFVNQNIEISALEAKRTAQEQIIEKLSVQMQGLPSVEQEMAFLERETESLVQAVTMLKMKLEQTKIRRDSKEAEIKILELARMPQVAVPKKRSSSVLVTAFIGFILGIALAFLLEYLDQSIKDPSDVERVLELPLIGLVPLIDSKQAIVSADKQIAKSVLEPFRSLRANVKHLAGQHNAKTFVICSAVKGEGKTTLAVNLAITFAMDGRKVVLIDGDLRRSQIHSLLDVPREGGVSDYLMGAKELDDILKPCSHKGLFVVTAGERPHNPSELLGTPRFAQLVAGLRERADIVICDSPALIPVSDIMSMAPVVDACIMVVRALWTPTKAAQQARNQLTRIGARPLGSVLNGISHSRGYYPYYYGYYGYYAYKYTYEYDEEASKRLTVREFGLEFERGLKRHLQNLRIVGPRYLAAFGRMPGTLLTSGRFWILFALLVAVVGLRYFLTPPELQEDYEFISYVGQSSRGESNEDEAETRKPSEMRSNAPTQHHTNQIVMDDPQFMGEYDDVPAWKAPQPDGFAYRESLLTIIATINTSDSLGLLRFYDPAGFRFPGGTFKEWRPRVIAEWLQTKRNGGIIRMDSAAVAEIKPGLRKTLLDMTVISEGRVSKHRRAMMWKYRAASGWRIVGEKELRGD